MKRIKAKEIPVVVFEPALNDESFFGSKIIRNLDEFIKISDVIVSNRLYKELDGVKDKVYSRDIFFRD
jgi:UDPglucose 6-dehydrogenase